MGWLARGCTLSMRKIYRTRTLLGLVINEGERIHTRCVAFVMQWHSLHLLICLQDDHDFFSE